MKRHLTVPVLFLLLIGASRTADADSGNPLDADADQWRFSIAFPMIWAPEINGKIRGDDKAIDFTIEFKDILENLSFGLMGELYANRGPFGLAFRTNFMRVEDERSRSGLIDTLVQTELRMGVNDLLASFRVHENLRLVTGVRHVFAKLELDIQSIIIDEQVTVADDNSFDLLFGINFDHWFTDRWGIMLNSDIGVLGDNDRDFSVDFRALYRISSLNNFWFGFRYLNIGSDTEMDGVEYVHIRHMDVERQKIGIELLDFPQSIHAVAGVPDDRNAWRIAEHVANRLPIQGRVVNDQNSSGCLSHRRGLRAVPLDTCRRTCVGARRRRALR